MKTRITELFGIRYPIVQGGMQWVGRAELVAAVANAGGLGMITALTMPSADDLVQEIRRCRAMTSAPFGVNLTMLPTAKPVPYAEYVEAIIGSGIRIVETAGSFPPEVIERLVSAGMLILHKCTAVRHALSAQARGVSAVSIDGFECAGHPGEDDVPNLVLVPAAVAALDIPVIASGGIADGRGMAAALALGAEGVNLGTRFMVTREAPIHDNIKQAIVKDTERDTRLIYRALRNTARALRNDVVDQVAEIERRPGGYTFQDIRHLVVGSRGRLAMESGDVNAGLISAGLVAGLIHDIPTCAELVERMVRECQTELQRALDVFA